MPKNGEEIRMSVSAELLKAFKDLTTFQNSVKEIKESHSKIEQKVDQYIKDLGKLEANLENLKDNVKNDILGEIKYDLARVQTLLEFLPNNKLPSSKN